MLRVSHNWREPALYMKKQLFILLGLLLVGGVTFGIYSWASRGLLWEDPSWPRLSLSSLSRVDVFSPEGDFSLVYKDSRWLVENSSTQQSCLADEARITELLESIGNTPPTVHFGRYSSAEGRRLGLDKSKWGITFRNGKVDGPVLWAVTLGNASGSEGGIYARSSLQGDQIYVVDATYKQLMARPLEAYVDSQVVSFSPADIEKVQVEGPGTGVWQVSRGTDSDGFVFSAPEKLLDHAVAQTQMELYLEMLSAMRASCYTEKLLEKLPPPQLKIAVWGKGQKKPETLEIYHSGSGEQVFLGNSSRQPSLVTLDADKVEKLSLSAFSLRERPVMEADLGEAAVQNIFAWVDNEVREIHANKTSRGWWDTEANAEITGLDMVMWRLGALQFVDKPVTERPATAVPLLSWEFLREDGSLLSIIRFLGDSALPAGRCWVNIQGEEAWFPVTKELLDDVMSLLPVENGQ